MKDYCDGSNFQSHPLFQVHQNGLQIFLYYDDVEFCNPLESKKSIHKLGIAFLHAFSFPICDGFFYGAYRNVLLYDWEYESYVQIKN